MKFFRSLSPWVTPAFVLRQGDLYVLRERILQAILLIFSVLGLPTLALAAYQMYQAQQPMLSFLYLSVYVFLFVNTLLRNLPYALRGNVLTAFAFALAIAELFESGSIGDMRVYLLAMATLTAILFDFRSIIWSIAAGVVTIAIPGIYVDLTPNPIIPALVHMREGTSWVIAAGAYVIIASLLSGSIAILVSGLATNLQERAKLAHNLEIERDALESRVQERTQTMARQMTLLHGAADISQAISGLSDPEALLQRVVDLIQERFKLYYVGVFLIDPSRQYAVLQAGTGEAGKRMIAQKHQLSITGSSMIGWSIANRQSRIALDVGAEAIRFNNPALPLTRSEIAMPLIVHDYVFGALTIQSEISRAFDEGDIVILESIANSLAIALENDRLYNETRESLEEIRTLNRDYLQRAWAETLESYGELSYVYDNETSASSLPAGQGKLIEVPLMLRNETIGSITLEMDRPDLSAEEKSFIENVTTQTAVALENARLLHETERRAIQEQKLNELASRFSRALNIDEILRAAAQDLGQLPTVAEVSVQINPPEALHHQPGNGSLKGDRL